MAIELRTDKQRVLHFKCVDEDGKDMQVVGPVKWEAVDPLVLKVEVDKDTTKATITATSGKVGTTIVTASSTVTVKGQPTLVTTKQEVVLISPLPPQASIEADDEVDREDVKKAEKEKETKKESAVKSKDVNPHNKEEKKAKE